nr:hypothetical protein [Tanacetum cinerariifolium]
RFTKVIIDYFMTRKPSISRRNRIHWHYVRDDALFSTIKVTVKSGAGKDGDEDDDEDDDDDDEEEETAKDDEEDKETGKGGDEVRESG